MRYLKLYEGLVHKRSLDQLLDIQKEMDKIGDIGREFTDFVEDFYDYNNDTDCMSTDVLFDMSNEIQHSGKEPDWNYFTRFGQGDLGENTGDLTKQEFANNFYQYNPLTTKTDTLEEFDLQYWFNGSSFSKVPKDGSQPKIPKKQKYHPNLNHKDHRNQKKKVTESMINESFTHINSTKKHIKSFNDFNI